MFNFWIGFILGMGFMLLMSLACAAWIAMESANFNNSWMEEEETKKNSST